MKKSLFLLLLSSIAWGQVTVVQAPVPKFRSFTPSGLPNVGGCVYTYASGTSTPQATYTDSTGLFANSNPVILDANGEAQIFITSTVYRFQVWSFGSGVIGSNCGNGSQLYQIDGIRDTGLNALNGPLTIAPTTNGIDILSIIRATDVSASGNFVNFKSFAGSTLFKVDINGNVTANNYGAVAATTGTFTGAISGTAISGTKAIFGSSSSVLKDILQLIDSAPRLYFGTSGIGGHTNFKISAQDSFSNVLEIDNGTSNADPTASTYTNVLKLDSSGNLTVTGSASAATGYQIGGTAPSGHTLIGNGTNYVDSAPLEATFGWTGNAAALTAGTCITSILQPYCNQTILANAHTLIRLTYIVVTGPVTCTPNAVISVRDLTSSTNLTTSTVTAASGTFVDSGALSVAMPAGHTFLVGLTTAAAGCGTSPIVISATMVYQ